MDPSAVRILLDAADESGSGLASVSPSVARLQPPETAGIGSMSAANCYEHTKLLEAEAGGQGIQTALMEGIIEDITTADPHSNVMQASQHKTRPETITQVFVCL